MEILLQSLDFEWDLCRTEVMRWQGKSKHLNSKDTF